MSNPEIVFPPKDPVYSKHDLTAYVLHNRMLPNLKAEFAMRIMDHIAFATCDFNGTNIFGTPKPYLLLPSEIVDRAVEIADDAFDVFEERGWLVTAPSYDDCVKNREIEHEKIDAK